ncbi:hypothetical protein, partial [uncultured Algoriphagus sp.]|uniref:hypothetical protein n=1 Tax=uncultured Algoriphagus sp. TaxID=417365 RepID=UPI002599300C
GIKSHYAHILPISNVNDKPIIYTTNICIENCTIEEKYALHGKLPVSFAIVGVEEQIEKVLSGETVAQGLDYKIYQLE